VTPHADLHKLERARWAWTAVAVVLAALSVVWLTALIPQDQEPGRASETNDIVLGVVILEVGTLAPLMFAVHRRRRAIAKIKTLSIAGDTTTPPSFMPQPVSQSLLQPFSVPTSGSRHLPPPTPPQVPQPEPPSPSAPPNVLGPPPPRPEFDKYAVPDLVVRPRELIVALVLVSLVGLLGGVVMLSYDHGLFDPRIVMTAACSACVVAPVARSRIVVVNGVLWRRNLSEYGPVSLEQLATVKVLPRSFRGRAGLWGTSFTTQDRCGRSFRITPQCWRQNAGPLLAMFDACARAQGIALDERTTTVLALAAEKYPDEIAFWARPAPRRQTNNSAPAGPREV
jgi:hypothetical protein